MHGAKLFTGQTKSGGHKAFVLGRVEKFGNERKITVEGQPHRGFATRDQAAAHAISVIPSAEALVAWASKVGDGEFISNEKKKDLALEEVVFPGAGASPAPSGPVMPLADARAHGKKPAPPPVEPDSEARIAQDATRQLAADPSLAGKLATSVDVVTRTKALQRTKEAEAAARQRLSGLELDDAKLEQAIRTFANAGELLIQFLRHTARIEMLVKERATIWECLLREFKTPELASAMVERARAVASAWVQGCPAADAAGLVNLTITG